jgi:LysM repeat protein
MRKFLLLVLLIAGWALIFSPLLRGNVAFSGLFSSPAHPSSKPLPQPWQGSPKIQLNDSEVTGAAGTAAAGFSTTGSTCGDSYSIQDGDTLGEIARSCGITLKELVKANPQIQNPNQVFTGQQIYLPDPLAGRGSGEALAVSTTPFNASAFFPGNEIKIEAAGLPASTLVRVGLGLSVSGYTVLNESKTDAEGHLSLTLSLPAGAQPGETGFILVTTRGVPSVQRVSETFTIENK